MHVSGDGFASGMSTLSDFVFLSEESSTGHTLTSMTIVAFGETLKHFANFTVLARLACVGHSIVFSRTNPECLSC